MARNFSSVGGSAAMKVCGPYSMSTPLPITDAGADGTRHPVSSALEASGCAINVVEHVEVVVDAPDHPSAGELAIELTSPSGMVSQLAAARSCGTVFTSDTPCQQALSNWHYGSVRHLGESAAGSWRLTVTDTRAGHAGPLKSWALILRGH